ATNPAGVQNHAGPVGADPQLHDRAADIDIAGRARDFVVADVVGVPVAELPMIIGSPAANCARLEQRAGVPVSTRDSHDGSADVDVAGRPWQLVVADALGVAVAELPVLIGAPAAHGGGVEQRTRKPPAHADLRDPLDDALIAAVIGQRVVVVTFFTVLHDPVAAGCELAGGRAGVGVERVAVVALLVAEPHDPVAAGRKQARGRAAVAGLVVAVLAILARIDDAVAAAGEHAVARAAIVVVSVAVVAALAGAEITVAADVRLTARVAELARSVVGPVIATLADLDQPVATGRQRAGVRA